MARLDKLLIQGIRSFGPEEADKQHIRFQSPITLILGQNGCGKTTIIECLKYVLIGELPPGARLGHSFIHDPKMTNKVETHAKIMLQYRDTKDEKLTVTRLMQLTQKSKNLKFESKDATLRRRNRNGQLADLSGRCADITVEVCTSLCVSKSILTNVIFCHQDESTWPMDESKKVKERFDSIFDATKYNKYIDNMKSRRKIYADDVKIKDKEIEYLKKISEEVTSKNKQLEEAKVRMTVNRDQLDGFDKKLEPINERMQKIMSIEGNYTKLYTEKEKKKTELAGVMSSQRELISGIKNRFSGSTEELEEAIQMFQVEMKEKENSFDELNAKLRRLREDDMKLQNEITRAKVEKGKLQAQQKLQDERIDARNKQLRELAAELEIQAMSYSGTQFSEDDVMSTLGKINRKMKQTDAAFEQLRSQLEKEEHDFQNKLDKFRDEKVSLEQQVTMKSKQIQETRNEAKKIKNEIEEVKLSATKLQRIEDRLKRTVRDLEDVEKSVNVEELQNSIDIKLDQCNSLSEQLEDVDREVKMLQQQSSIQAELDIQRDSKSTKETEIRKLKNKHEDTLKDLLKDVPEEGIKYELKLCIDRLGQEVKEMNDSLRSKNRELTALETNRKHQKDMLRKKEDELKAKEDLLYDSCGDQEYKDVVKKHQESVQNLQDQKGTLSSSEYMFKGYIQKLQNQNPCCPLCHRGFDLASDVQELVRELNTKIREVPSLLRENTTKLDIEQRKYKTLLELKPTYEDITTLNTTEIPRLRNELKQTEEKLGALRREVENLEFGLALPQADKDRAERIQPDIVLLDQHHKELKKLEQEIERLEAKLPPGCSSKSMEHALNEQDQMKSELNKARQELENKRQKLSTHRERVQKLKEEKNCLNEERLKIESGVQQRKQLEEKYADLQATEFVLVEEIESLRENLGTSKRQFEAAVKEKETQKIQNKDKLRKEQKKISEFQKQVDEINRYQSSIHEFEQKGVNRKLDDMQEFIQGIEEKKDTVSSTLQDVTVQISDMNDEISKQQIRKRDLEDNLKLRKKEEDAEKLKKAIEKLQNSLGDLNLDNILKEKKDLIKQEESINREKAHTEGMLKEQQSTILTLRADLAKPLYKDNEKNYLEKVVDKEILESLINDILIYQKAVEKAAIQFHQEKMSEINRTTRELWRQIYRGNDIDYIEIKTDIPETGGDKRRNYNYRLVQMKSGVELDMRGRCSAGQKVLASLIVRLALAQTFCSDCGVLALDEPTTNLDKENVESLSTALAELISSKFVQQNFQLIIITHDEEFLERLSKVEKMKYYYRVSRNDKGLSVIEKLRVDL